jgi:CRP/FNR family transcriptional regulator, cyclic AMP receptor protein
MKKYQTILKQADILADLSNSQIELFAAICQEKAFNAGTTIVREGSNSSDIYILVDGHVYVEVNPGLVSKQPDMNSQSVVIATLWRGQSFGEMALVDEGLRSASIRTGENGCKVICTSREQLLALCEKYPQLGFRLMYNLAADLALKIRTTDIDIRRRLLIDLPTQNY